MKKNLPFRFKKEDILTWLFVSVFVCFLVWWNPFPSVKDSLLDSLFLSENPSEKIVLVTIDDASIGQVGQWPWPRAKLAELLSTLQSASVIGVDINLKEASRLGTEDDERLSSALKEMSTPVVLSYGLTKEKDNKPLKEFSKFNREGFSNILLSSHGIMRRFKPLQEDELSFAYEITQLNNKIKKKDLVDSSYLKENQPFRIHYHGSNGTYNHISAADVLSNKATSVFFKNKIVLVGVTAKDLQDYHQTPFGVMSGVEIQANIAETLLERELFYGSKWLTSLLVVLFSALAVLVSARSRSIISILASLAIFAAGYYGLALISFNKFLVLDVFYPFLALIGTAFVYNTVKYVVTVRKKEVLKETFKQLRAMVESMQEGVLMVDTDYEAVVVNPVLRGNLALGKQSDVELDDIKDALRDKKDEEEELNMVKYLKESIRNGKTNKVEEVYLNEKVFNVIVSPVRLGSSPPMGAVMIFQDITGQKELERVRREFTSMIVHELRSPLTNIRNVANMISEEAEDKLNKTHLKYMKKVEESSSQMIQLVGDILDAAKLEAGEFEIYPKPVEIRELVEGQVDFFAASAEDSGVELKRDVSSEVPEKVNVDKNRITQVLRNLLSNAVKYTKEGNVTVQLIRHKKGENVHREARQVDIQWKFPEEETFEETGDSVVVAVTDTGSGIPPSKLDELFNKFKQFEESAKNKERGTGLGLSIAKGIVEAHGGVIGVGSEEGEGSTFYFTIPLGKN